MPRSTSDNFCLWCRSQLQATRGGRERRTCSKACRQALWRFHVTPSAPAPRDTPRTFAYADPPYPGRAHLYPGGRDVNHKLLINYMADSFPDGWALSTAARSLRDVLLLCPPGVRVCAWLRSCRPHPHARIVTSWEPLILCGSSRQFTRDPHATKDALIARGVFRAHPGALIGMKPPAFAVWMFKLLGAAAGDNFVDLFPGSGAITTAWRLYTRQ